MRSSRQQRRSRLTYGLSAIAVAGILAAAAAMLGSRSGEPETTAGATPITVQLDWVHGGDFAGFYAAEEMGYYEAASVAVSYLQGDASIDPTTAVTAGEAQFGTSNAYNLLHARAKGQSVRAIACILQRSPLVFAARQDSGIQSPRDFAGKTIRVPTHVVPTLYSLLARNNVEVAQVTTVQTRDTSRFASGEIDIWAGYLTGAVRRIREAGHKLTLVYPDDFGIHAYHECIFATDELIQKQPELVARFLRATLKGWSYTANNVEEAATMVAARTEDGDVKDALSYVRASRPLFNLGATPIGWMSPEIWEGIADDVGATDAMGNPIDSDSIYTLDFLKELSASDQAKGS